MLGAVCHVPTELRPSQRSCTGTGLFLKAPAPKGWVIRADPIVSLLTFSAREAQQGGNAAIELHSGEDIDALIQAWAKDEADVPKLRGMMSRSISTVPAKRTDTGRPLFYVLSSTSLQANHCVQATVETVVENDMLLLKAVRDLSEGEELLLNYNAMNSPKFLKTWCARHGLTDMGTLAQWLTLKQLVSTEL